MIINDLDDYYIVFDAKNRNTELDTLITKLLFTNETVAFHHLHDHKPMAECYHYC